MATNNREKQLPQPPDDIRNEDKRYNCNPSRQHVLHKTRIRRNLVTGVVDPEDQCRQERDNHRKHRALHIDSIPDVWSN